MIVYYNILCLCLCFTKSTCPKFSKNLQWSRMFHPCVVAAFQGYKSLCWFCLFCQLPPLMAANQMSRIVTKPAKRHVRPVRTQISLHIHPVWSQSSLCVQWAAKDPSFLQVDSEDLSDWVDAQADSNLRWAHSHFVSFDMRQLILLSC